MESKFGDNGNEFSPDYAAAQDRWNRVRRSALGLTLFGFVCWISMFLVVSNTLKIPKSIQLPMSDLGVIQVDGSGRVYCASHAYSRIQVYDARGRFIRGWFSGSRSGKFIMRLDKDGNVQVTVYGHNVRYLYNADGDLLKRGRLQGEEIARFERDYSAHSAEYAVFGKRPGTTDKLGNSYRTATPLIYPRVIKREPSGRELTFISTPFYLWLMMGPFPAWLFGMFGIIIGNIADARLRKLRSSPQSA